ncbi:YkoF family thiamine/hydroxymethylpyrimidine-binding protein [Texcoconibacillus texcoconensis]|uniref:Uncharacterized protein YqgV (UPF0045/DUF77 family) n=1 Tax=Texcoconibacillus texcoconensis TaxID=1095777 RepID=A0A840QPP5_9BACI|nr:YkoF family thiamine/hydroxymethylpyrimidine-binding protein [Texcoconibacillus texcoconensis]MBB5173293.1 uncharacterized protein YqgV (UPF0045/DUF77 family) [Texcoconibacillus texcoconensis]
MESLTCGNSRIVGCRFSVHPMADDFKEMILTALNEVDMSKVWSETDDITTCIRGRSEHVFDVTRAIYARLADTGVHVAFNGTFSVGCPGDTQGHAYMDVDGERLNIPLERQSSMDSSAHFAVYPMGTENYMPIIASAVEKAQEHGTFTEGVHYASRLDGNVHDVFATLEEMFVTAAQQDENGHLLLTATLSANSPSKQKTS